MTEPAETELWGAEPLLDSLLADDAVLVLGNVRPDLPPWKILVVDDDRDVHAVTRLILQELEFRGRPVQFLAAGTAGEARDLLATETDIALLLLDVVMETDGAGLQLVRYIRDELQNRLLRIILRTGHPGQAPERGVVLDYDIDDYTAKTEMTAQRLFTSVVSSLRTHEVLASLDRHRRGLERIVAFTEGLLQLDGRLRLVEQSLAGLPEILGLGAQGCVVMRPDSPGAVLPPSQWPVVAARGRFLAGDTKNPALDPVLAARLDLAWAGQQSSFASDLVVILLGGTGSGAALWLIAVERALDDVEWALLKIFAGEIVACFQAVYRAEALAQANLALTELTATLEERVTERTMELERLAMIDPLTDVSNRRHFYSQAARAIAQAKRLGQPLSVLMMDLDLFKRVNDLHGHAVGDQVLKHAAALCSLMLRAGDFLGRLGGEEFGILLPGATEAMAGEIAERIRRVLAESPVVLEQGTLTITASLGVASLRPDDAAIDPVLDRADQALYRAKQAGRNQVGFLTGESVARPGLDSDPARLGAA